MSVSTLFCIIGPIFVILGCYMIYDDYRFKVGTRRTWGRVVRNDLRFHTDAYLHFPIVEFTDEQSGKQWIIESTIGSNPPAYRSGDPVQVRYHPERPQEARLDTSMKWGIPGVFILLGTISLTTGLLSLLSNPR
jgi:hypothetical protein